MQEKPYEFIDRSLNLLKQSNSYEDVYNSFKWSVPEYFNIGQEICDKYALDQKTCNNIAIRHVLDIDNKISKDYTFKEYLNKSNQLANKYNEIGLQIGDRVIVHLPQGFDSVLVHTTTLRCGMVSLPISTLFGPDALEYRINHSEATCFLTDLENLNKILNISKSLPSLKRIIVFSKDKLKNITSNPLFEEWNDKISNNYSINFKPIKTKSTDPAIFLYTSGTVGNPKGVLHNHHVLIGCLTGAQFAGNYFPQILSSPPSNQSFKINHFNSYTPADYSWVGGLLITFMPTLFYGSTLITHKMAPFNGEKLINIIKNYNIKIAFIPPSALKLTRICDDKFKKGELKLLSVLSGGESLSPQLLQWGKELFGCEISEVYGQTEANICVANCPALFKLVSGSMGKSIPGHCIEIINSTTGEILPPNTVGSIGIMVPTPVSLNCFWKDLDALKKKIINGKWLLSGDIGKKDNDGYLWYIGRDDDIINSSGYRIGPSEIESCILKHSSVSNVGVIGIPDDLRGQAIKAYIVLKDSSSNLSVSDQQSLKTDIQNHVKTVLAAHEYPKEIEFIKEMPVTTTGKIIRRQLRELHLLSNKNKLNSKL